MKPALVKDNMGGLMWKTRCQPRDAFVQNQHDGLGRLLSTILYNSSWIPLNSHAYEYNDGHQRTKQTFTAGNYVDYTFDNIGQLKTAKGQDSGGTTRPHEQFGYAYDKAWNLNTDRNLLFCAPGVLSAARMSCESD